MNRHLVLVGLPGSGKTTVGRRVAELLGSKFTDLDDRVVAAAGMSVADIFARHGEIRFRQLERAAMDAAIADPPQVIAPGAGWIAQSGNLEAIGDALLVYLRLEPKQAAARLEGDVTRPLLPDGDRHMMLQQLLEARQLWYERAPCVVEASAPVEMVAGRVLQAAMASGIS